MIFTPINGHLEVKPDQQNTIVQTQNTVYEERGTVISVAEGVTKAKIGEKVFFDSWRAAKFIDSNGQERWLVPEENIRAVEKTDWKLVYQNGG